MDQDCTSPEITNLTWGQIKIQGFNQNFKDVKLFPGGACEWDWGETGTRHKPGVKPADIDELLEKGANVVIVGCGMLKQLEVMAETQQYLKSQGIALHILQTEDAVKKYNQLRLKYRVGGLFHTTC